MWCGIVGVNEIIRQLITFNNTAFIALKIFTQKRHGQVLLFSALFQEQENFLNNN